jgi:3-oxoacyl-[acyl-carrier-protein] synthase-3/clorobiocin biosynthesis protein CloN2
VRTSEAFIQAIGVFLPEPLTIESAVEQGLYSAEDAELHGFTGVAVAGDTPAPEMALHAAQDAFKRAGRRPDDVDLLLYASSWHQGPDGWQPQYYLQRRLVGDVLAVELRHGCNGMFSALELAAGHLRALSRPAAALLVAADNFGTPLVDRWRMGPGYLAGDAASAVLLATEPGFARLRAVHTTTIPEAEEVHRGGEPLFPPGATVGRVLDFRGRTAEYARRAIADGSGTVVWLTVHRRMLENVERTLTEAGVRIDDIARVAFMNYSREIVEQRCMTALGLPMSKSTWEFGRSVGHLAASDQMVSLEHLLATGQLVPGDHVLLLGIGPGITISSAVVEILAPPPWLA